MTRRAIFITGASSGIGLASALHLHRLDFRILAGVLPGENTDALTEAGIDIVFIDLTRPEMIASAKDRIMRLVGAEGLYGLFNNAGYATSGPIEFLPIEVIRQQLEVNLFGHIQVTQGLLPLIRRTRGRIVNTNSILGRIVATAFSSPYCMSKFAMEAFTDSLRLEMRPFGVSVSAIEPGVIRTPIWSKFKQDAEEILSELPPEAQQLYGDDYVRLMLTSAQEGAQGIPPEAVAKAVAHAFTARRPKTRYIVGADAKAVMALRMILSDRALDWVLRWRYPTTTKNTL
ncbi:MAG: SDR family NAD(P)-dependent oxidoreductase [bacterium]|nr:SDR family NAD(P)-dependent oxidoreductase [bacterium]